MNAYNDGGNKLLKNTGERLILDQSWNIMTTLEHVHRYKAATVLSEGKIVLDAACGTGYGSYFLSESAKQVYGIDISNDAIIYAKEHYQNSNLQYLVMSVDNLCFKDKYFDVVTSFETIEHINQELQIKFLMEIKKKLKNDGILIMSTPNDQLLRDISYGGYINEFHVCEFDEKEYIEFLKQYFKYVKIYYQTVTEVSSIVKKGECEGKGAIFSRADQNKMGRYYVAICSDEPIDNSFTLESVLLPELKEYFDEAYFKKQCMLFVDSGEGFGDSNKIIGEYVTYDGKKLECSFDLTNYHGIQALRFDPCEHGGKISIEKTIGDNNVEIKFEPINSDRKEEEYDLFMTLDPQYIFSDMDVLKNVKHITIYGKMELLPDHIIITHNENEIEKMRYEKRYLNEVVEEFKNERERLRNEIQRLNEVIEKFQGGEEQLRNEIQCLNRMVEEFKNEREQLRNETQRLNDVIIEDQGEKDNLLSELGRKSLIIEKYEKRVSNKVINKIETYWQRI